MNWRLHLSRTGLYRPLYTWRRWRAGSVLSGRSVEHDLVCVLHADHRGWIIEGICREVERHSGVRTTTAFCPGPLPDAPAYFLAHWYMLGTFFKAYPCLLIRNVATLYTHEQETQVISKAEETYLLNCCSRVFVMNSSDKVKLIGQGVDERKLVIVYGGADPDIFRPHPRGSGVVGFCSAFYERKNPGLILDVIHAMPDTRFMLVGKKWDRYSRYGELNACRNLDYIQVDYGDYPALYSRMDVFVSPSTREGGPIPLIEAMMSNCVPVASRTGFAPDIIHHGINGLLFENGSTGMDVVPLIRRALTLTVNVSETVKHLSWKSCVERMCFGKMNE